MSGILGGRQDKAIGPWAPQAPYIKGGLEQAQNQFIDNPNPYTQQGQQMAAERGMSGAGFERAGQQQLEGTLRGDYLFGGPGFNAAYEAASNKIIPQVASQFERFGRHGSPAEMASATGALGDAFAGLYGQERQRQMGALGQVPGMQGVDYRNIGAVSGAGDVQRQLLERYMQLVGQRYGTTQEGAGGLPWAKALGGAGAGALSGAKIGSVVPALGTGMGAGIGGLAGLLGGLSS